MPAWSDNYAGPLRQDQIRDITAYVMNWESTAPDRQVAATPSGPVVGTDITKELPAGNPENGETLSTAQGCMGCHISTNVGPAWQPSAGNRGSTTGPPADHRGRLQRQRRHRRYLFDYIGPGRSWSRLSSRCAPDYGQKLTDQDVADLIAYLLTLK
jgi:mono/diheme cytochrome c family protein